jgi:hypothetical protein
MNAPWKLICIILAMLLFGIGAFASFFPYPASPNNPPSWRTNGLMYAGLFFYMLSLIVTS